MFGPEFIARHMPRREPEHIGLNAAVGTFARRCWPYPHEWDLTDNIHDAPTNLKELNECVAVRGKLLIWSGACEDTIFGSPEYNQAFRAWHDWTHHAYQLPFTLAGEAAAIFVQCRDLLEEYGYDDEVEEWVKLLLTEVIGQCEYRARNGEFPINQREFSEMHREEYALLAARICIELTDITATAEDAMRLAASIYGAH